MMKISNRREALKSIATAGVGALLATDAGVAEAAPIQIAGRPIEVTITAATPQTVRIVIQPIENGPALPIPQDGALVKADWGAPALRWRLRALADAADGTGVTVRSIEPRSAADLARLRAGDRIEGANSKGVANLGELRDLAKRGGTLVLTVRRGNAIVLLPLRVP